MNPFIPTFDPDSGTMTMSREWEEWEQAIIIDGTELMIRATDEDNRYTVVVDSNGVVVVQDQLDGEVTIIELVDKCTMDVDNGVMFMGERTYPAALLSTFKDGQLIRKQIRFAGGVIDSDEGQFSAKREMLSEDGVTSWPHVLSIGNWEVGTHRICYDSLTIATRDSADDSFTFIEMPRGRLYETLNLLHRETGVLL